MKIIKKYVIAFLFVMFTLGTGQWSFAASAPDLSDIESFIDSYLIGKIEEENIPNLVVNVVANGEIVFEKGYGYANIEKESEVNPEATLFRVGSVSKLFTWTAIMQLVEEGKLDLHTDINEYLDFDIPDELVVGENSSNHEPITIYHLMTHTSGFEDYSSSLFKLRVEDMPLLGEYVRQYRPERIFPAGEVIAYSNYAPALAGYIVEQVSGMSYSDYVEENIFKPLDMNLSSFDQPLPDRLSTNLAQAYRYIDGEFKKGQFEFMPLGAGGLSTTGGDMAKFMQAYLDGGEGILEKATVEKMFQQQFTQHPKLDGMTLGFMEKTLNGKRIIHHGGSTALFDAAMYLIPEENIGLFIAYSGNNFFTHKEFFNAFKDHYFPVEESVEITSIKGENSSQFVGEYHQNRKSLTNSDKLLSLTIGKIHVKSNNNGELLVTINRDENRFIEIEPGIYENTREGRSFDAYGEFSTIVFQEDPFGNVMLTTDGPMTYSKASWYASSGFTFLSIIAVILLFVGCLTFWGMKALIRRKRKVPQLKMEVIGKRLAIALGILLMLLVVGIALSNGVDPIYGLPKDAFGMLPAWASILDVIFILIIIFGILMIIFTAILWWKRNVRVISLIHFTLLSIAISQFFWIVWYWNIF